MNADNPFLFDLFCTVKDKDETGSYSQRRPKLETLYDVFVNVRDDEKEHWKTLCNLVQYDDMQVCFDPFFPVATPPPHALHAHTHTRTHAHKHTRTHTHTHTHTIACMRA